MTARRPLILVPGTPGTIRELIDGDIAIIEAFADRNGLTYLETVAVASAVNRLRVLASAAGGAIVLSAQGSDTNIDLALTPKGSGKVRIVSLADAAGLRYLEGTAAASAVNYLRATAAASGGAVVLSAQGADSNIYLQLLPKGTGKVMVEDLAGANGLRWLLATVPANSVNYLQVDANSAGGGPFLWAKGTDTNIDLHLVPKGDGKLMYGFDPVVSEARAAVLTSKDLRDPSNLIPWDPSFGCVKQFIKRPAAAVYEKVGIQNDPTYDGTQAAADSPVRPLISHTTAATTGAKAGFITSALGLRPNWYPQVSVPIRWGADVDRQRVWVGLGSLDLANGTAAGPTGGRTVAFMFSPEYGDLEAMVSDGAGDEQISGTPYTPVADEHVTLQIRCRPDGHGGGEYFFYLMDPSGYPPTLVAQIASSTVNPLLEMHLQVRVETTDNVARVVRAGSIPIWMT